MKRLLSWIWNDNNINQHQTHILILWPHLVYLRFLHLRLKHQVKQPAGCDVWVREEGEHSSPKEYEEYKAVNFEQKSKWSACDTLSLSHFHYCSWRRSLSRSRFSRFKSEKKFRKRFRWSFVWKDTPYFTLKHHGIIFSTSLFLWLGATSINKEDDERQTSFHSMAKKSCRGRNSRNVCS